MKKHLTRTALSMAVLILVLGTSDIATAPGTLPSDAGRDNNNLILYYGTLSALSVPAATDPLQALLKLIRKSKFQIIEERLLSPPSSNGILVSDGPGRQPDSEKTQTAAAEDNGDNPLSAIQLRLKKLQKAKWQKAPAVKITVPYASNNIKAPDGPGGQPATSAALLHTGAAASTDPCDPSFLSMLEEWSKQQGPGGQAAAATSTPNAAEDYETTLQRIQQLQQERVQLASEVKNWAELIWDLHTTEQLSEHGNEEEIRRKKEVEILSERFDKSVMIFDLLKKAKGPSGRKEVAIAIEFIQKRDELASKLETWRWSYFGGQPEDFKKEFPKLVDELVELWRS